MVREDTKKQLEENNQKNCKCLIGAVVVMLGLYFLLNSKKGKGQIGGVRMVANPADWWEWPWRCFVLVFWNYPSIWVPIVLVFGVAIPAYIKLGGKLPCAKYGAVAQTADKVKAFITGSKVKEKTCIEWEEWRKFDWVSCNTYCKGVITVVLLCIAFGIFYAVGINSDGNITDSHSPSSDN